MLKKVSFIQSNFKAFLEWTRFVSRIINPKAKYLQILNKTFLLIFKHCEWFHTVVFRKIWRQLTVVNKIECIVEPRDFSRDMHVWKRKRPLRFLWWVCQIIFGASVWVLLSHKWEKWWSIKTSEFWQTKAKSSSCIVAKITAFVSKSEFTIIKTFCFYNSFISF